MHVIVMVTCPDGETAEKISTALLDKRLAACVNAVPGVRSRYWWKGKVESAEEVLLLIKTRESLFAGVEKAVKEIHPYEVPEILSLPLAAGSEGYLRWMDEETRGEGS